MQQANLFETENERVVSTPGMTEASFLAGIPNIDLVKNRHYESFDVYIGRGTKWGNPFKVGVDGEKLEVIMKYKRHLWQSIRDGHITRDDLIELHGKTLGCSCAPKACHGHVLLCAVEWARNQYLETPFYSES